MIFPKITRIEPILAAIQDRNEFVVASKLGYIAIDYNYVLPDSFDHPLRLECRGLKFTTDGDLIGRPFHKFFNYGEKNTSFDVTQPHTISDKLDGSMVHTVMLDGKLRLMTRMGLSPQALAAEELLTYSKKEALTQAWYQGYTVIFEYVGPENQIVLRYNKAELVLLAVRHREAGNYAPRPWLETTAAWLGVRLAEQITYAPGANWEDTLVSLQSRKDVEGVVISQDGHLVKLKTEDYVSKHRAVNEVLKERNFAKLVLEGKHDDVIPFLPANKQAEFTDYAEQLITSVEASAWTALSMVTLHKNETRQEFARLVKEQYTSPLKATYFSVLDGVEAYEAVVNLTLKQTTSTVKWQVIHDYFELPEWKGFDL